MEDAEINVRCVLKVGSGTASVRSPDRADKLASSQSQKLVRYVLNGEMHLIVAVTIEVSIDDDSIVGGRVKKVANRARCHNTMLPGGSVLVSKWWCWLDHVQIGDVCQRAWKSVLDVVIHNVLNSRENSGMLDQHTS